MFCMAPMDIRDSDILNALVEYAKVYSRGYPVPCRLEIPDSAMLFLNQLSKLESAYQVRQLTENS